MKKSIVKISIICICILFSAQIVFSSDVNQAEKLLQKAKLTSIQDESYEYINAAREIYEEAYSENPLDVNVLLGLSKTFQLIGDRAEAKLYVLKAYNMNPADPMRQKAMGDFFYSFQEYSTAIEYYKLALASGLLRNYETNLQTAKCFEKLGDLEQAELYYKICLHLNSSAKNVMNKINEYDSMHKTKENVQVEEPKYKYLYKSKKLSEEEQIESDASEIIKQINQ